MKLIYILIFLGAVVFLKEAQPQDIGGGVAGLSALSPAETDYEDFFPLARQRRELSTSSKRKQKKKGPPPRKDCDFLGTYAIANSCASYYHCLEVEAKPIFRTCPRTSYYDHIDRKCVPKTQARCRTKEICPKDGVRYFPARGFSKQWFLECTTGVPFPTKCEDGTTYDKEKQLCS